MFVSCLDTRKDHHSSKGRKWDDVQDDLTSVSRCGVRNQFHGARLPSGDGRAKETRSSWASIFVPEHSFIPYYIKQRG